MPSNDETVVRQDVETILARIRQSGWKRPFDQLCDEEPVLAGFALAMSDKLCIRLERLGVPGGLRQMIETEMMSAQVVCIESMRQASRQLWQDFLPGTETENKP